MDEYPDIPVSLHGWELENVERIKALGRDYYEITYKRDKPLKHVSVEITITADILGWAAQAITDILHPVDLPPSENSEPELLTEGDDG